MKEIKNGKLFFDGCNTVDLALTYGTPLYVFSENAILKELNEIKECFLSKYDNTRAAYASKAFCTIAMFEIIKREGFCIDVVSGGELYTAIKAEFPPEKIEFNGNNKSYDELCLAIDYGVGRIIIDGLQELSLIETICKEKGKKTKVLYRITPEVKSDTHDYITTGKKDSKFGIPLDKDIILPAIENALKSEYVELLGFHFHVGSQLFDNSSHLNALETTLKLCKDAKELFGFDVKELNVGGGFGVTYTTEVRKSYEYFLEPIVKRIEQYAIDMNISRPAIVIEPGRSIVAEAGISLYTVGNIKDIKDVRKYVAIDGGMTDNIRPALYQAKYDGVIANKADLPKDDVITICGKCCESGDILIKDGAFQKAETGDILAMFSTGAYGYSMANNYNKVTIPAVVLVKDGKHTEIVRRQSLDDLIARETYKPL